MYTIIGKRQLSEAVFELTVEAPHMVESIKAGQFLMLRTTEVGERIPLTFSDWNVSEGWIKFIFMRVGKTTHELSRFEVGQSLHDLVGPLGNPTEIDGGRWVVVGGGVGTSVAYPVARALCEAGARVDVIVGSRTKDLLILQDELSALPLNALHIVTDDGTFGEKGMVTAPLKRICEAEKIDRAFIVGPAIMMKFASMTAAEANTPSIVSLNPLMVDGTGMCGACRCTVGGKLKFGCVDGPEFEGDKVDWEELMNRQRMYLEDEKVADAAYTGESV